MLLRLPLFIVTLLLSTTLLAATPIDRIVVVVNESVILQSELNSAMDNARTELRQRGITAIPETELRDQVLERLILTRIQTERAKEAGIRVDDRELNEVIANIAQQNGMSVAQFAAQLRREGQDYLAIREQIRSEVISQRLRSRELEGRVNVTSTDVDAFLAQQQSAGDTEVRLSHILVSFGDGASPDERREARDKANRLLQELRDGGEFARIAAANSDGQQALEGGDLGWRRLADLPQLFARPLAGIEPGELTGIIEAASGYHILRMEDRRGGSQQNIVTETRARHILISPDELTTIEDAEALARDIARQLDNGADFAELAKQHSDDPGSKNSGGDLGWQPPGQMVPAFEDRMQQLDIGERSAPFQSQFGWHVVEVLERRERDVTDQLRRQQARQTIGEQRMQEEYEIWLRRLRDEAFIEYRLGEA